MSHGGKGDTPRPLSVSQDEYQERHEAIFGKRPPRVPYVYVSPEQDESTEVKDSEQGG